LDTVNKQQYAFIGQPSIQISRHYIRWTMAFLLWYSNHHLHYRSWHWSFGSCQSWSTRKQFLHLYYPKW